MPAGAFYGVRCRINADTFVYMSCDCSLKMGTRRYRSVESLSKLELTFEFVFAQQDSSMLGPAFASCKLHIATKRNDCRV